jgi:hypothetical protein
MPPTWITKVITEGGTPAYVVSWAAAVFFVVGGTLFFVQRMLNLWIDWRNRPR